MLKADLSHEPGQVISIDRSQIIEGDWMIKEANLPQEVKDIRETLETYVKTIVPEYSVCIVQCPEEMLEQVSKSLDTLNHNLVHMRIVFVACPMKFKITVIPAKSEVSLENDSQAG